MDIPKKCAHDRESKGGLVPAVERIGRPTGRNSQDPSFTAKLVAAAQGEPERSTRRTNPPVPFREQPGARLAKTTSIRDIILGPTATAAKTKLKQLEKFNDECRQATHGTRRAFFNRQKTLIIFPDVKGNQEVGSACPTAENTNPIPTIVTKGRLNKDLANNRMLSGGGEEGDTTVKPKGPGGQLGRCHKSAVFQASLQTEENETESGGGPQAEVRDRGRRQGARRGPPGGGEGTEGSDRRASQPVVGTTLRQRSRFYQRGQAIALFRVSARKVLIVLSWFKGLTKREESMDTELKSFLDMVTDIEGATSMKRIEDQTGLSFDPKYFCANREVRLCEEIKTILTMPSRDRSPEMVQKVIHFLHNLKAFAEYPIHMQQKFAKVAWFQEIPPKRLILKQGHTAENFYFILAGTALVKQITRDATSGSMVMRAVARIQNGQSFGEIALLHQTLRTATVESATNMHVLVITREDFQRIFFKTAGGQEPEHLTFCRKYVDVLQGFPMELCMKSPSTCMSHFFKPGAVVVADSKKNEWICIVKSGSCRVLKRLAAVTPHRPWCYKKLDLRLRLPRDGTTHPGPKIDTRLREKTLRTESSSVTLSHGDSTTSVISQHYDHSPPHKENTSDRSGRRARFLLGPPGATRGDELKVKGRSPLVPEEGKEKGEVGMEREEVGKEREEVGKENERWNESPGSLPAPTHPPKVDEPGVSANKVLFLPEIKQNYMGPPIPPDWVYLNDHKNDSMTLTGAMTVDSRSVTSVKVKDTPTIPCFVQLRKLRPRDVFGLEDVEFDDDRKYDVPDTSVTLVSNGCEVIMLSRRLFERHAPASSRQHLREKVCPFPSDSTLQRNLQVEVNWDLYRKDTIGDFIRHSQQSKEVSEVKVISS